MKNNRNVCSMDEAVDGTYAADLNDTVDVKDYKIRDSKDHGFFFI
jgi:hypothetical protein